MPKRRSQTEEAEQQTVKEQPNQEEQAQTQNVSQYYSCLVSFSFSLALHRQLKNYQDLYRETEIIYAEQGLPIPRKDKLQLFQTILNTVQTERNAINHAIKVISGYLTGGVPNEEVRKTLELNYELLDKLNSYLDDTEAIYRSFLVADDTVEVYTDGLMAYLERTINNPSIEEPVVDPNDTEPVETEEHKEGGEQAKEQPNVVPTSQETEEHKEGGEQPVFDPNYVVCEEGGAEWRVEPNDTEPVKTEEHKEGEEQAEPKKKRRIFNRRKKDGEEE